MSKKLILMSLLFFPFIIAAQNTGWNYRINASSNDGSFDQQFQLVSEAIDIDSNNTTSVETSIEQLTKIYCYNKVLTISFAQYSYTTPLSISLYDMIGNKVFFNESIINKQNKFKLNIEPGMYIAILESKTSKPFTKKIIIE